MRTLIAFATKSGCTRRYAETLAGALPGAVLCDLKKDAAPALDAFEAVVVGGPIRAGRLRGVVRRFVDGHGETLKAKRLGLFICCMSEGEKARKQLRDAFPGDLFEGAAASAVFGGAFDFETMNLVEKAVVRKVAGVTASVSRFDAEAAREFARRLEGNG